MTTNAHDAAAVLADRLTRIKDAGRKLRDMLGDGPHCEMLGTISGQSALALEALRAAPQACVATPPQPAGAVDDAMVERGLAAARDASDARLSRYRVVRAILEAARIGGVVAGVENVVCEVHGKHGVERLTRYACGCSVHEDAGSVNTLDAAPSPTPGVSDAAMESWHSAVDNASELFTNAPDQRYASRASQLVTYLKANRPTPPVEASGREAEPLTAVMLADALESFWNAALGHTHRNQSGSEAIQSLGGMAEGFAAVAARLRELATPSDEPKGNGNG